MPTLTGQSFGRYHILEQLGEGGMATVFKAYDTRLERDVAVKVIRVGQFPPDLLDNILKRFEREAKALARLTHPNIVPVIDYGEHEGAPYLVMPFLPGGTLKKRLGKPILWQEAVRILHPIALALEYAHEQNIIHRDIKPANILLTQKDQPMLSDFGIAKLLETKDAQTLTGTGVGVGTPEYMAPEQWTGETGLLSDVYSLGVVFYELVTGRKPYTADTPAAILLKQASEPLPRPTQFVPDLPGTIEKILLKVLARKPEDRYESMAAFARALDASINQPTVVSGIEGVEQGGHTMIAQVTPARMAEEVETKTPQGVGVEKAAPAEEQGQAAAGSRVGSRVAGKPGRELTPGGVTHPRAGGNRRGLAWGLGAGALLLVAIIVAGILVLPGLMDKPFTTPSPQKMPTAFPSLESPPTEALSQLLGTPPESHLIIGVHQERPADGMVMMAVPAGKFTMGMAPNVAMSICQKFRGGCSEAWFENENPVHIVILSDFLIDKTEVTNAMYQKCVDAGKCTPPPSTESATRKDYFTNVAFADFPVVNVSWADANAYCAWARVRLPTEAEWEKAARGSDRSAFPWGDELPDCKRANFVDTQGACEGDTRKVGAFPAGASSYGALDMAGNVWEWVADWYAPYPALVVNNPFGPVSGEQRLARGGSWGDDAVNLRSSLRYGISPDHRSNDFGFRCARTP